MRPASLFACWSLVGGSIALACGGSSDTDLFGSSTDATSSSSGGASSSGDPDATTSSSGATSSSGGTTSSSGATTSSSGSGGVDAGGDGGGAKDAGTKTCRRDFPEDCGDGEFCKVTSCAANGTCAKKPTVPAQGDVVCGCDGISYWNAALAASFGISVNPLFPGACQGGAAKTCSAGNDCPGGRHCNYQTTATMNGICAITLQGSCWGMPSSCPNLTGGRAKECGSDSCKTYCEAVKAEKPWFEEQANKCN